MNIMACQSPLLTTDLKPNKSNDLILLHCKNCTSMAGNSFIGRSQCALRHLRSTTLTENEAFTILAAAKCSDLRPNACGKTFTGHNHNIYYMLYIYGPAWCYIHFYGQVMLVINICLSAEGMHCIILTGKNFGA